MLVVEPERSLRGDILFRYCLAEVGGLYKQRFNRRVFFSALVALQNSQALTLWLFAIGIHQLSLVEGQEYREVSTIAYQRSIQGSLQCCQRR